jgi:hypothetical protein
MVECVSLGDTGLDEDLLKASDWLRSCDVGKELTGLVPRELGGTACRHPCPDPWNPRRCHLIGKELCGYDGVWDLEVG